MIDPTEQTQEEQLKPAQDTRQAIQTFSMYHYQSLLNEGYSVTEAKEETAELLEKQYYFFTEQAGIRKKNLGTMDKKIERMIAKVAKSPNPSTELRDLYNDLLELQAHMRRKP